MTPADHLREAEAELNEDCEYGCPHAGCAHEASHIARAQAHALIAAADFLGQIRSYLGQMQAELEHIGGRR